MKVDLIVENCRFSDSLWMGCIGVNFRSEGFMWQGLMWIRCLFKHMF